MIKYNYIKKINPSQIIDEAKLKGINIVSITQDGDNVIIEADNDVTSIVNNHIPKIKNKKAEFEAATDKIDFIAREMGLK